MTETKFADSWEMDRDILAKHGEKYEIVDYITHLEFQKAEH